MNYQSKWSVYCTWCRSNGHRISAPTVRKFADFLIYLHADRHLSTSAIKGYRSVLNGIFALKGYDFSSDPVLAEVIRTCARRAPRRVDRRQPWNVDVVLKFLSSAPFEPLPDASLRDLTVKTVFLVALATARRVGELQSLAARVSWSGPDLLLSYLPEFVAKTESSSRPVAREFLLRSLSAVVESADTDRLLCPVRAVSCYLERTASPNRSRHLFLSVRDQSRAMSRSALSFFLRSAISRAHVSLPDDACPPLRVRAHDVRGMAASLRLWANASVPDILTAACWRTASVFADFYLKEVQRHDGEGFSLGPFVAAGGIIS